MIMFALFFVMLPGLIRSKKVDQTPQDLIRNLTESAVVTCSHSDQGFELILWYKRSDDKGFIFLGYLNNNFQNPEDEFKDKIELAGDGRSSATLTIKHLTADNSGVYYCAARRHSVLKPHNPEQKHFLITSRYL
ncbi:hypothetical protein G5714_017314 [Onychostoma macrolepis]|uniref:Ig-like domain-containing protein n=1 Tax=Onychostoma macrolepis TaxID=369639 RepID=A0A7J6C666_9TELE|nr:hypothetical protein G5714_017314 [Onychostoma macrolepis]